MERQQSNARARIKVRQQSSGRELEFMPGAGDTGAPVRLVAERGERYELSDTKTGLAPRGLRARRMGLDLYVFTEGHEQPDLVIERYFDEPVVVDVSLQGTSTDGRMLSYAVDQLWYPSLNGLTGAVQPIALAWDMVPAGWGWIAAGAGGVLLLNQTGGSGTPAPPAPSGTLAAASDTGLVGDLLTRVNTPTLKGAGATAGHTIKVTLPATGETLTTVVAADGTWSVTVTRPLPDTLHTAEAVAISPDGKETRATLPAFRVDASPISAPLVAVPEALDGVSAFEAADGTPLVITVPVGAATGDTVTTVVTRPDGQKLTLTSVLTAADLVAGNLTQTISQAALKAGGATYLDGQWSTSTRVSDAAGNVSDATLRSFNLDTVLIIQGTLNAGPVEQGVRVEAFDRTGGSLGTADVRADGSFQIRKDSMGDYRGPVLLKASDVNGAGSNFKDEVTAASKSLDTALRAIANAEEGSAQFQVVGSASIVTVHITPVTELAVRKAGVVSDQAPSSAVVVSQANSQVAQALGLGNSDITAEPVPTNSAGFNSANGLSAGERYGILLAKLSGLDNLNAGSIATSLAQIEQNLAGTSLTPEGAALVDQGRQQALAALKAAPSTAEKTFTQDTPLNRQLLGDIVVTNQTIEADGKLTVAGIALPGSTVKVKMPDGSNREVVADATGVFSATSAAPPPTLEKKVEIVGQDGLAQSAAHQAPAAPVINTGNGKLVTGSGTPGSTVTLTDNAGAVVGIARVDSLGQWSLAPAAPLADDQVLKARAADDSGNVSAPGAGVVDIEMVSVQMPSAGDGYISAAERASGAVRYQVALPGTARAGDQVRTTLTRPDGSVITYVDTLTPADLTAGRVERPVPITDLVIDGEHRTAISLVTTVGSSAPAVQSFILDASVPIAPVVSPSNGQVINGTSEPGTTVVVSNAQGVEIGRAKVAADGNWTLIPSQPLPNGTVLSAVAVDPAGNTSPAAPGAVVTGTLLVTGAVDSIGPVLGLLADGATTNDTSPTITGTLGTALMPGQSLAIYRRTGTGEFVKVGVARTDGLGFTFQDGAGSGLNTPLIDGTHTWRAVVETATGPVSGLAPSGDFDLVIDNARPTTPTVNVPEASGLDTTISPAERMSDGGVPIVTLLGARVRAGDVVTTEVQLPDGSTRTLTSTLSQADVLAGRISQLLNRSALASDGAYVANTTVTSGVNGLSSAPAINRFTLDTTPPAAPWVSLPESLNGVSAAEAASAGGTPVSITLAPDARVGDTITTVVTSPGGTSLTLTTVLTAADLPSAQGGYATGSGPFTISQVIPSLALIENGAWITSTRVTDIAGNVGPASPGGFTLDTVAPSIPAIALPESPGGVSAAEAASGGGTPIVVTLPADVRVGDTVSTIVTNPNGASTTLTTVLTAADLPVSQGGTATGTGPFTVSQVIPSAALTVDGTWATSTTLIDVAGNVSAAQAGAFTLDITPPGAPIIALPESPNGVSAAEAASSGGTPIVVTLPVNARIGDTVTTVVTHPNGATSTLTAVLTAADLPVSQGGTATGSGPFTISQVIPSTALTVDGAWTTSTTLTDVAGNVSAPGAGGFTLDLTAPSAPATALPESPNGVSAAEAASSGGTPLVVTLPVDAKVGDTVSTVVTNPGGTRTTLNTVLSASDLPVSQGGTATGAGPFTISQVIPSAALTVDGAWTTSTTLTDVAGNVSMPTSGGFTLDTTAPTAPAVSLAEAPLGVSAAEAASGGGTPLRVALPADARAGDIVTTEVTRPNGSKLTLSAVLSAADITQASVSLLIATSELVADGSWWTSTTLTDIAGNTSAPATAGFLLDVQSPSAPSVVLAPASDTGVAGDNLTRDNTPTLTGAGATPGDTITIRDASGQVIASAVVLADGTWGATALSALPDGVNPLQIIATDPFGNPSPATPLSLTIDTQAPAVPGAALAPASDSGIPGDGRTNDSTPTLRGSGAMPGDRITVTFPGTGEILATTVAPDGTWSVTPTQSLADGTTGSARVVATDAAGNSSSPADVPISIDLSPPAAPAATLAAASDTGIPADRITNDSSPTITVTGAPGDTITLKDGSAVIGTAVVAPDGSWTITPASALSDGVHPFKVTATDPAGNTSAATDLPVTIDTSAPVLTITGVAGDAVDNDPATAPTPEGLFDAAERGASPSVVSTLPAISGTTTAEAGQTVTVALNGRSVQAVVQAGASGQPNTWSAVLTQTDALALNHGNTYSLTASVTDRAGNAALDTDNRLRADIAAPDVPTVVEQFVSTLTPTLSGIARKIDNTNTPISLASGDTLSVTVEGFRYTLTVGGSSSVTRLSDNSPVSGGLIAYSAATASWAVTLAPGNLSADGDYEVLVSASAASVSKSDASSTELHVNRVPPSIVINPVSPDSSGRSVLNGNEDDQMLTITGMTSAEVGALVTLTGLDGITRTATVLAGAAGQPNTFSLVIPGAQVDLFTEGTRSLVASVTNRYGLTSTDSESVLVDTIAPAAPVAALDASSDSGTVGDSLTSDSTPTLSGTGTAGDTITIRDAAGSVVASAVVRPDGSWSATPSQALAEGTNALNVTATDPAGNEGAPSSLPITIDTRPPSAPAAILAPSSDTGITGDGLTSDDTPTLSGSGASPGDRITVTMPGTGEQLTATVAADGTWSVTPALPLPNGTRGDATVTATDPAGNTSPAAAVPLTVDTQAPSAASVVLPEAPSGVNRSEAVSNGGTPLVISLPADARVGDTVTTVVTKPGGGTITLSTVLAATDLPPAQGGTASGSGPFTLTQVIADSRLSPDGAWTTRTVVTDAAGNTGAASIGSFTLDTTISAPSAALDSASDTGVAGDGRTGDATPTLSGTGTPGDTITVRDASGNGIASATVQPDGSWSATPSSALPDGLAALDIIATDAAGNVSDPVRVPITIDTTAPAAPVFSSASDNAGAVTGSLIAGARTDDATPTLVFSAEPGSTVRIYDGATLLGTATEGPAGTFSFTPATALSDGVHRFSAAAIDASGSASGPSIPFPLTVDTAAPVAPVLVSMTDDMPGVTGGVAAGTTTNDARPTVMFTAEAGAVLKVYDGATLLGTATEGPAGTYTFTPAAALAEGGHSLTARVTDAVGNESPASVPFAFSVDTVAPSLPAVSLPEASDGVNSPEAASGGGTPLTINLPADAAVGDTVTTVVTTPYGTTITLTTVLQASDLPPAQGGTAGGSGPFSISQLIPTAALTIDGSWATSTTLTDTSGNSTAAVPSGFTLDTTGPLAPALVSATDDVGPVTGALAGGASTNDTRPALVFTAEPGSTLRVYDGISLLGTAAEGPSGTYTFVPTTPLTDGTYSLNATATDAAGNTSAPSSPITLTVDTAAPAAPSLISVTDDLAPGTGALANGARTNDATPTLVFSAEPGSTVQVYDGTTLLGTATEGPAGTFTLTPASALTDGVHNFSARAADAAGNVGPASSASAITIDTAAPANPVLVRASDDVGSVTGAIASSARTDDTRPTLVFTAEPGSTVSIYDGSTLLGTAIESSSSPGTFTFTPGSALSEGAHSLSATATDVAGNSSGSSTAFPLIVDSTAPAAPQLVSANDDVGPVTGPFASGGAINDTQPTLVFSAEPGSTVTLYDGATPIGTAVEGPAGTFTFSPATPLAPGSHSLTATATDVSGNTSGGSMPFSLLVDTTAPAAPVIVSATDDVSPVTSTSLASGSTTNDATPTLSLTAEAGSLVRIYNGSTLLGTATETSPGNFSFTPSPALAEGTHHLTASTSDAAGNVSAASATFTLTVDTTAPTAPTVAAQLTNDTTPVITGTAVLSPGETLRVTVSGATYDVVPAASGAWSLDLGTATPVSGTTLTALTDGTVSVTATVIDAAGNVSSDTSSNELQIDATPPAAPAVAALTTSDTTPVITGTATLAAGETLKIVVNGATYAVTPTSNGSWSLDLQTAVPASGTLGTFANNQSYPVTATAYDAAGNASSDSTTNELAIDLNALSAQLAASSDTGIAGDRITLDDTPRIEGTTGPGATVTITEGGVTLATVVADATTGAWGVDTAQLADGVHTLTITDSANKTVTLQVTIDRTPPSAPPADLDAASDSGTTGDRITSDTTPTISGQGTAGDTITIKDAQGNTIATATVQPDGTWSATPPLPIPEGLNTLAITATDPQGNASSPTSLPITIDTTAPVAPTAVLDPSSDSGVAGDARTNDTTPTISGTGSAGDTITVRDAAGNVIASAVVQPNGTWSATPASALPEGLNTLSVKATDPAGNTGPAATLRITIDTTPAGAPTAVLDPSSDSGVLGDRRTSDSTPTLSGTGTPGDAITVKDGAGNIIATGTVQPDGTWSATPATPIAEGLNTLAITATDSAGNTGNATSLPITIDTTAPALPTVTAQVTHDPTPVITGTAVLAAGETLSVTVNGATYTVVPAAGGAWSLDLGSATPASGTLAALSDGVISVTATARDAAGNATSDATSGEIRLDTTPPSAPAVSALTTSDTTPVITGTATLAAGETLAVVVNGATYSVTPASDGSWSLDLQTAVPVSGTLGGFANNQQYPVTATATDAAGNSASDSTTNELLIDLNALSAQLAAASDTGAVGDRITRDDTPTIEGVTGPGATVTIRDGSTVVATVVADSSGAWSVDTSSLSDGVHTLAITDSLNKSVSLPLTIDRSAPAVPVLVSVTDDVAALTGMLTSGASTNDNTPSLVFTAEAGSTVKVYNGTTLLGNAAEGPAGTFTFTPATALADGLYAFNATAGDAAGNVSAATSNFNLTIDTVSPAAPVLVSVTDDVAGITGTVASGAGTNDNRPTLVFTAEAGSTVSVFDGTTLLGTATEGPAGTFTFTPSASAALADGAHSFTAKAADAAGNSGPASTSFPVTIDTSAPSVPTIAVPESGNGVNASEAASDGGTPLVVTLPADARVGDTVTIVVTRPNGTTITLSTVLQAADLPASQGGTASGGGPFTINQLIPTSELSNANNGSWGTSTTITDPSGNSSAAATASFTLDTVAPTTAPTVVSSTAASVLPTITGAATLAAGESLSVTIGSGTYTVTPNGSGQWSLDLATAVPASGSTPGLFDGQTYSVTARVVDSAGNAISDSSANELTITLVAASVAITSEPDNLTNDPTPVITGTSSLGSTPITVSIGGASYTVVPDSNGNWTLDTGTATPAEGTFSPNLNGTNTVVANLVSPAGTTVSATQNLVIDTTAPIITIASIAGDTVTASSNGTFDLPERGFDNTSYTLNNTVTTLPVISGTTDAEVGRTVTVTLNGAEYSGVVASGGSGNTWSITVPDVAARALNHGNTYAVTARVTDAAGNDGSDTNNGMAVNIAPPDVPTVVGQLASTQTPTITGLAQKLVSSATTNLAAGDQLLVVIKNAAGTSTLGSYSLTVGGTSSPAGLTYNTSTGGWTLAVPSGVLPALGSSPQVFQLEVSSTAGGVTRSDVSTGELVLAGPPSIASIDDAGASTAGGAVVTVAEVANGTVVRVSLSGSGAQAGQAIRLQWDNQTVDSASLLASDITNGYVDITVPTAKLQAATTAGTRETLNVVPSLAAAPGGAAVSTGAAVQVTVDFRVPTAPVISNTAWSSSATSTVLGIPEANYDKQGTAFASITGTADNRLYFTEVNNATNPGTLVRVQIPTAGVTGASSPAVAGDQVVINWGDQTVTSRALVTADITAKYIDIEVPWSVIQTQPFGAAAVSAQVLSAASGNLSVISAATTVTVNYAYDLPLLSTGTSSPSYGFRINGRTAGEGSYGLWEQTSAGDVNGDGYDDFVITGGSSYSYVVFGRPGLASVELSDFGAAGNTQGFRIKGFGVSDSGIAAVISGRGDFNGDGLADLAITPQGGDYDRYVVFGRTSGSDVVIAGGAIAASDGFSVAVSGGVVAGASPLSFLGDVNGDGFDDLGQSVTNSNTSGTRINYAVIYGSGSGSNLSIPWQLNGGTFTGGETIQANGQANVNGGHFGPGGSGGDINGDGYADVVVRSENWDSSGGVVNVFFGGRGSLGNEAGLATAGNGRGYVITGFNARNDAFVEAPQDVNGDGLDDLTVWFNEGNTGFNTYVLFGKTDDVSFSRTELTAGTSARGFIIDGLARNIGDFNGDGLADFLTNPVSATSVNGVATGARWVIYGKTSASRIVLTNLQASEGFRIDGLDAGAPINAFSAAGDINGDGFADVLLSTSAGDPPGRTDGGITYVVYGGVSDLNAQVFQASAGDRIGTSSSEALSGTSGNNQIVGGDGSDTLQGLGGFDVLYGGNGNDRVEINASNIIALTASADRLSAVAARIDGGGGIDTLVVDSGAFLSVAEVAGRLHAIESIERIELVGSTLQVEDGQGLTINEITGPFNRFNTGNGWTLSGSVTGFDGSVDYHQLLVDGGADSLLRLGTSFVKASGSLAYAGGVLGSAGNFDVYVNAATRTQLIVRQAIPVQSTISAPTLSIPEASSTLSFGALTLAEANDGGSGLFASSVAGTPVVVGLSGTGVAAGQKVRVIWDGQAVDYTLTSADITAGEARVTVPTSVLTAATPAGTVETFLASVQILDGAKSMVAPTVASVTADFRTATAPLNAPVISASNTAASVIDGITEAKYVSGSTVTIDNLLYLSEATDGTTVQVFLKSAAAAGDWIRINWGDQSFTYPISSAVAVGGSVSVPIPFTAIKAAGYGTVEVSVQQFSANGVAGTGIPTIAAAQKVNVEFQFDLPLALPGSVTAPSYGFAINGASSRDYSGIDISNIGDVNGDGLEDLVIGAPSVDSTGLGNNGRAYVVYGKTDLQAVELSSLSGSSTQGFMITGDLTNGFYGRAVSEAGDLNGDGIGDILIGGSQSTVTEPFSVGLEGNTRARVYAIFGSSSRSGPLSLSEINGSNGFSVRMDGASRLGFDLSEAGDVNGDGLDDFIIAKGSADATPNGAVIIYGRVDGVATVQAPASVASSSFSINATDGFAVVGPKDDQYGYGVAGGHDINGDGYDDVIVNMGQYGAGVIFGSPSRGAQVLLSTLSAVSNTDGFQLSHYGTTGWNRQAFVGDVNGDGLGDIVAGGAGDTNYVIFGQTSFAGGQVQTSSLVAAGKGFSIAGMGGPSTSNLGDFNGDGLDDLLFGHTGGSPGGTSYVIYGKTDNGPLHVSALSASQGFRILGETLGDNAGYTVSAAGDVNGDGFADLIIGAWGGTPMAGSLLAVPTWSSEAYQTCAAWSSRLQTAMRLAPAPVRPSPEPPATIS